jgi:hypothetical protein
MAQVNGAAILVVVGCGESWPPSMAPASVTTTMVAVGCGEPWLPSIFFPVDGEEL